MSFRPAPDPGGSSRCISDNERFGKCERQRLRDRVARDGRNPTVRDEGFVEAQAGIAQIERLKFSAFLEGQGDGAPPVDVISISPVDVAEFIDQQPVGGFRVRLLLTCAAALFLDGFDTQAIGNVAGAGQGKLRGSTTRLQCPRSRTGTINQAGPGRATGARKGLLHSIPSHHLRFFKLLTIELSLQKPFRPNGALFSLSHRLRSGILRAAGGLDG
jgi:hypothetical protein